MGSGGVTVSPGSNTTTLAFTDADGNVITSNVDTSPGGHPGGGVTIVTADSLVGSHFLSDTPVTKLEIEDDVTAHLPNPTVSSEAVLPKTKISINVCFQFGTATNKQQRKSGNVPEGEKKVCLWPTGNGTTCGKTFTKFDSLKRHLAEAHKGVRPFACSLCDKSYGRRDYLQRHLKSHNANYAVNLASASNINASQVVQTVNKVQVKPQNTIILQQGPSMEKTKAYSFISVLTLSSIFRWPTSGCTDTAKFANHNDKRKLLVHGAIGVALLEPDQFLASASQAARLQDLPVGSK